MTNKELETRIHELERENADLQARLSSRGRKRTLTQQDIEEIKNLLQQGERKKDIALKFGVSRPTLDKALESK